MCKQASMLRCVLFIKVREEKMRGNATQKMKKKNKMAK
jgi:hypothetical protein